MQVQREGRESVGAGAWNPIRLFPNAGAGYIPFRSSGIPPQITQMNRRSNTDKNFQGMQGDILIGLHLRVIRGHVPTLHRGARC